MSAHTINTRGHDHFQPEAASDPYEQRRIRAHLDQIDYAAYASNKVKVAEEFQGLNVATFERMAVQVATARVAWLKLAMAAADHKHEGADTERFRELSRRRLAFEELAAAYEGLRRLVERGYVR